MISEILKYHPDSEKLKDHPDIKIATMALTTNDKAFYFPYILLRDTKFF